MERLTFPVITIKYMQVITIVKRLFFRMSGYKEERRMDFYVPILVPPVQDFVKQVVYC